jgi:hypothetical protein
MVLVSLFLNVVFVIKKFTSKPYTNGDIKNSNFGNCHFFALYQKPYRIRYRGKVEIFYEELTTVNSKKLFLKVMFPRHSLQKPQSKTDEQLMLHI